MAWEWSHTQDAYANALENLCELPRETRNVIAAEWLANKQPVGYTIPYFDSRKYAHSLVRVANWTDERIDDFIWERAQEQSLCTNGGWQAWLCPHGCGCHMVSFDREEVQL